MGVAGGAECRVHPSDHAVPVVRQLSPALGIRDKRKQVQRHDRDGDGGGALNFTNPIPTSLPPRQLLPHLLLPTLASLQPHPLSGDPMHGDRHAGTHERHAEPDGGAGGVVGYPAPRPAHQRALEGSSELTGAHR